MLARRLGAIFAVLLAVAGCAGVGRETQTGMSQPTLFPAHGAVGVNPDTHLTLTFDSAPAIGTQGVISIYDAADGSLVDRLDMSIPPSPRPTGRSAGTTEAERQALGASSQMSDYQVDTIGGVDFHFFPIIVRGAQATIYPHQGKLTYGRTYVVKMDASVLTPERGTFEGFGDEIEWRFSTRLAPPPMDARRLVVAADGSGDFNTVQGALDFVPANPAQPIEIFIRRGRYEELIYLGGKSNLIIRGEDRERVEVSYPNNSAFNPPRGGPSRRPAFSIQDSRDIQLSNFTIRNHFFGQAEALLARGERIVIDHMTLLGSGDALTTGGTIYMADSTLVGDGDTILGYAALFCLRCEIRSAGPFTWTRTPQGGHGNVFVDSTFIYEDRPLPWTITGESAGQKSTGVFARLPRNGPQSANANFPYAEMVLIDARTKGVPPEGWGPIEDRPAFDWSNVRFMEFNTRDMEGGLADMSQRHPIVRVLNADEDAELIANYRNPSFVLGGWTPAIR